MSQDHLQTLRERAAYLGARVEAKKSVGWEYQYDERERAALAWAISILETDLAKDDECYGWRDELPSDPPIDDPMGILDALPERVSKALRQRQKDKGVSATSRFENVSIQYINSLLLAKQNILLARLLEKLEKL